MVSFEKGIFNENIKILLVYGKIIENSIVWGDIRLVHIIVTIVLVLGALAAIASWLNTQAILRDLSEIKGKLGIKESKKPSFLDKDLDKD